MNTQYSGLATRSALLTLGTDPDFYDYDEKDIVIMLNDAENKAFLPTKANIVGG